MSVVVALQVAMVLQRDREADMEAGLEEVCQALPLNPITCLQQYTRHDGASTRRVCIYLFFIYYTVYIAR